MSTNSPVPREFTTELTKFARGDIRQVIDQLSGYYKAPADKYTFATPLEQVRSVRTYVENGQPSPLEIAFCWAVLERLDLKKEIHCNQTTKRVWLCLIQWAAKQQRVHPVEGTRAHYSLFNPPSAVQSSPPVTLRHRRSSPAFGDTWLRRFFSWGRHYDNDD